jgi:phospholipid/cholesterol/gamma-HCH transport system ATP-binding protein
MIRVENLYKKFDGNIIFNDVSLEIKKGEIMALIGSSGAGKSVLLKHLVGLLRPDRGRVLVDGKDISRIGTRGLMRLRNRIGFLFQGGALFDSMNVFDNVAFPLREKTKLKESEIRKKVLQELELVALPGAEEKFPAQLSGGMRKRAALARALVQEPEIMFFDEPTTGLDPIRSKAIMNLIMDLHKRLKFTGLIVTHEIFKVFEIVDRVTMLNEGVIVMTGTPEEVFASRDPLVQEFIEGKTDKSK